MFIELVYRIGKEDVEDESEDEEKKIEDRYGDDAEGGEDNNGAE